MLLITILMKDKETTTFMGFCYSLGFHGVQLGFMGLQGVQWGSMGTLWVRTTRARAPLPEAGPKGQPKARCRRGPEGPAEGAL